MPTLYWKNEAADGLWTNENNWFTNAAGTTPATFGSGVPRCPWVGGYYPNYDIDLATGETGTPVINIQMEMGTPPLTLNGGSGTCFIPNLSFEAVYVDGGGFYSNIVTNADTLIFGGHFLGNFTNYNNIVGGTFDGLVINNFNIDGGTFSSTVDNYGTITSGTFQGLYNEAGAYVFDGTFTGFENIGTISGGQFNANDSINSGGNIDGGTFSGIGMTNNGNIFDGIFAVTNVYNYWLVEGGTFSGANFVNGDPTDSAATGTINNGTFTGTGMVNELYGVINNGTFSGANFTNLGVTNGGSFSGTNLTNNGTISGTISCPSFGGDGNYEVCTFSGSAIPHMVRNGIQLNSSVGSIIISNDQASLMDVLSTGFL